MKHPNCIQNILWLCAMSSYIHASLASMNFQTRNVVKTRRLLSDQSKKVESLSFKFNGNLFTDSKSPLNIEELDCDSLEPAKEQVLKVVRYWFTPRLSGHAVIEIIFEYQDKFINVLTEGFIGLGSMGKVICKQFFGDDPKIGEKYLDDRESDYIKLDEFLIDSQVNKNKNYEDAFTNVLRFVNYDYERKRHRSSEIVDGSLQLNSGCLWYAHEVCAELLD